MLLAEEGEGANALDDVVFPAVGREGVVDGERSDARQRQRNLPLVEGVEVIYCEIEAFREEPGQFGSGAHSKQPVGLVQKSRAGVSPASQRSRISIWGRRDACPTLTQNAAEVLVASLVLGVEAEAVAVPVEFGADDGFDPGGGRRLSEFDGAVQAVFVG